MDHKLDPMDETLPGQGASLLVYLPKLFLDQPLLFGTLLTFYILCHSHPQGIA